MTGTISFDNGQFPVVITVDSSRLWDAFVELIHLTRDEREGDRIVVDGLDKDSGAQKWKVELPGNPSPPGPVAVGDYVFFAEPIAVGAGIAHDKRHVARNLEDAPDGTR